MLRNPSTRHVSAEPAQAHHGDSGSTGGSGAESPATGDTTADPSASGTAGNPPIVLDVGTEEPPPPPDCQSTAGDSIFLLGLNGALHQFRPATHELETLGVPACEGVEIPDGDDIVHSTGILWAMMASESGYRAIYTIDPVTLECTKTDFDEGDIYATGLVFVSDELGGETESLYMGVNEGDPFDFNNPMSLGRIDLATMKLDILGTTELVPNGHYQFADLTGTGEAKLFGFFPGDTAVITEFDAPAAEIAANHPLSFGVGSPWAFAQWGGRLWLFYASGNGSGVRTWDPDTGDVEDLADISATVVGAAVSTCAPFTPEG